jgi:hypothetical protein
VRVLRSLFARTHLRPACSPASAAWGLLDNRDDDDDGERDDEVELPRGRGVDMPEAKRSKGDLLDKVEAAVKRKRVEVSSVELRAWRFEEEDEQQQDDKDAIKGKQAGKRSKRIVTVADRAAAALPAAIHPAALEKQQAD